MKRDLIKENNKRSVIFADLNNALQQLQSTSRVRSLLTKW